MLTDPSRALPSEIWTKILLLGSADDPNFGQTVAVVCSGWRQASLGEKTLWTRFSINEDKRSSDSWYQAMPARIQAWLTRSHGDIQEIIIKTSTPPDESRGSTDPRESERYFARQAEILEHLRGLQPNMKCLRHLDVNAGRWLTSMFVNESLILCESLVSLALNHFAHTLESLSGFARCTATCGGRCGDLTHPSVWQPEVAKLHQDPPARFRHLQSLTFRKDRGDSRGQYGQRDLDDQRCLYLLRLLQQTPNLRELHLEDDTLLTADFGFGFERWTGGSRVPLPRLTHLSEAYRPGDKTLAKVIFAPALVSYRLIYCQVGSSKPKFFEFLEVLAKQVSDGSIGSIRELQVDHNAVNGEHLVDGLQLFSALQKLCLEVPLRASEAFTRSLAKNTNIWPNLLDLRIADGRSLRSASG